MKIRILGPGCSKCKHLSENVKAALKDLDIRAEIIKITDRDIIASYGVMFTPALMIDEKVVVSGKVPTIDKIKNFLISAK